MKHLLKRTAVVWFAACAAMPALAQSPDDVGAVRHLLMQTFDKPDARLTVDPVTVEADIAVAGWAQGDRGGRALLRRKDGGWTLVLCSGDALKDATALRQFGLTPPQAQTLAEAVITAESKLDPTLVEKFSRFDGIVMMDEHGAHPPVAGQNPPKH